jgi:putative SOS response-associated peptidase YedK
VCGRYVTVSSPTLLAERFDVTELRPGMHELEPNYNVAPRADVPVIAERHGERVLDVLRWGLIPSWAKDAKIGYSTINACADTVATKPAFRAAFKKRRCLVLATAQHDHRRATAKEKCILAILAANCSNTCRF